jgi:cell division FtsZ-interacting protein ZapD
MTEAEIMEQINKKRSTLEQYRTAPPADSTVVKVLEDEIKTLESSLSGTQVIGTSPL